MSNRMLYQISTGYPSFSNPTPGSVSISGKKEILNTYPYSARVLAGVAKPLGSPIDPLAGFPPTYNFQSINPPPPSFPSSYMSSSYKPQSSTDNYYDQQLKKYHPQSFGSAPMSSMYGD